MLRIITQQAEAKTELRRICDRTSPEEILHKEATVREVLQAVKRQGDKALLHYTEEFDNQILTPEQLRVSGSELDAAYQQVSKELLDAIQLAARQVEAFHRQRVLDKSFDEFFFPSLQGAFDIGETASAVDMTVLSVSTACPSASCRKWKSRPSSSVCPTRVRHRNRWNVPS